MFIETQELETMLEGHVIDEITGDDRRIVDEVIKEAVGRVESYLNVRYDTAKIFARRGRARNKDIMYHTKIIAVWTLLLRSNVETLLDKWQYEYERTIDYLKDLVSGTPSPDLPLLTDDDGNIITRMRSGSHRKFNHYY